MSQQTPPNHPEDPDRNPYASSSETPSFAQENPPGANPYYAQQRAAPPDLDEGSPTLTTAEAQRLNRKALFFLGGIVLLLLLVGYFALWGGKDEEDSQPARQVDAEVNVPRAPASLPADPFEDPNAALAQQDQAAEVPVMPEPLPVVPQDYENPSRRDRNLDAGPRPPTLVERRMGAAGGNSPQAGGSQGGGDADRATQLAEAQIRSAQAMQNAMLGLPPEGVAAPTVAMAPTNAQFLSNPQALLVRGTYLRCILETRIITDIPGFTSCILTEPVYSVNGRQLLLPKGSKILGQYQDQEDGVARVAVVWDRIITPTGIDVTMKSPGVDGLGGAGHPGDYDGHWGQKIGSALLISLISDAFQWAASEHGPRSSTTIAGPGGSTVIEQPFQSATARSMERLANQALQRSAQRPGTVTINQGTMINVYVAQDVDFSSVMAVR